MPAYAHGQRYVSKNGPERERYSDPDATWGHRSAVSTRKGGGFYGYRLHASVCTPTDLPSHGPSRRHASMSPRSLLPCSTLYVSAGSRLETCVLDKGYDNGRVYRECADRDCVPIIPPRETPDVRRGEHKPPTCEHGEWRFAGADHQRKATKWRCPTGACKPASVWVKVTGCIR